MVLFTWWLGILASPPKFHVWANALPSLCCLHTQGHVDSVLIGTVHVPHAPQPQNKLELGPHAHFIEQDGSPGLVWKDCTMV